jgi:hypothetical protein
MKIVVEAHNRIKNFLKDKEYITIHLDEITAKPEDTINQLIEYLEINPSNEQIDDALKFVHPELLTQ